MNRPATNARTGPPTWAIVYLVVEIVAVLAFWAWLAFDPEAWRWFVIPGAPRSAFGVFAPADLLLIVGLAAWCAWTLPRRAPASVVASAAHAGAVAYATIVACSLSIAHPQLWPAAVMMLPMCALALWILRRAWRGFEWTTR